MAKKKLKCKTPAELYDYIEDVLKKAKEKKNQITKNIPKHLQNCIFDGIDYHPPQPVGKARCDLFRVDSALQEIYDQVIEVAFDLIRDNPCKEFPNLPYTIEQDSRRGLMGYRNWAFDANRKFSKWVVDWAKFSNGKSKELLRQLLACPNGVEGDGRAKANLIPVLEGAGYNDLAQRVTKKRGVDIIFIAKKPKKQENNPMSIPV